MSEEYASLTLFQALSIEKNTKVDAVRKISTDNDWIKLVYCIPKNFSKTLTDVSPAEGEEKVGPDTGPATQFIEIMILVDRQAADRQDTLQTLMQWHGALNTKIPFRRGFIGLENSDNPTLNLNPTATIGYREIEFMEVNPTGNKGKIQYVIKLELKGSTLNLPVFTP